MAAKKTGSKGKRYSADQKKAIIEFVHQYNADHRRGGASAASKKFGVSQLTIGSWLRSGVDLEAAEGQESSAPSLSAGKRGRVLGELSKLDSVIAAKRKELDVLEARFRKLKASL